MGFIFVGNRLFVDFINTQIMAPGGVQDLIETFPNWLDWLHQAEVINLTQARKLKRQYAKTSKAVRAMSEVKKFRQDLRNWVDVLPMGRQAGVNLLKAINQFLQFQTQTVRVKKVGSGFVQERQKQFNKPIELLQPIAQSVSDFLCGDDPSWLKKCSNEGCILYFYDISKNHRRRWCSMKSCGNRAKVAAHYRRNR